MSFNIETWKEELAENMQNLGQWLKDRRDQDLHQSCGQQANLGAGR